MLIIESMKTYKDFGLPAFRCKNYSHTYKANYTFDACANLGI